MDSQTANDIANEIRRQIGKGALYMMGAQNFVSGIDDNGNARLMFRIRGSRIGNCFHITLMPSDTYKVELYKIHGTSFRLIDTRDDIYNDVLREVLGRMTGLAVSMPRIIGINA
jgi:hypothetical protein